MAVGGSGAEVERHLRDWLGTAEPGDRLPPSRELVESFSVSPGTVARAVARLVADGLVRTEPGRGSFVVDPAAAAPGPDTSWQSVALARWTSAAPRPPADVRPGGADAVSLSGGYLHPDLQPRRLLTAAWTRAGRVAGAWQRSPCAGLVPLRRLFAAAVSPAFGSDDVLVTSGGQAALSVVFRALEPPGATVLVESPTYPGALAAVRAAHLRPVPVPVDRDGVRPDLLRQAFELTGARTFYCQPAVHNPTGVRLAAARRAEVLAAVREAGAFLVEDDFARLVGTDLPPPLAADDPSGSVIHLTSLTKPAAPGLRIGAIAARGPVRHRLEAIRHSDDYFVATPLQHVAIELLTGSGWERHLRSLRSALGEHEHEVRRAIAEHWPTASVEHTPGRGIHLWVRMTEAPADVVVADRAAAAGVLVDAGHRFYPVDPPSDRLRLNVAAAPRDRLADAVRRLAAAAGPD